MSGPKLSQAEIERMRQERLEQERQAALKRLMAAQAHYRGVCSRVDAIKTDTRDLLGRMDSVYKADIEMRINSILDGFNIICVADVKSPGSYNEASKKMETLIMAISEELDKTIADVSKRDSTAKALTDANTAYQTFNVIVDVMGEEIKPVKIDFKSDYDVKKLRKEIELLYLHFLTLSKREDAPDIRGFSFEAAEKLKIIVGAEVSRDNYAKVRSVLQKMINDEQELVRIWNERRKLYDEYHALAVMTDNAPKNSNDFENAEAIKLEIKRLRYLFKKQDEMDYIADQINEAMVDLGYSFVTSRVLTRNNSGETDFSLYKADNQTGIAVYTDQSGAVMMRMTVLGDDPFVTEEDRDFSYQRQIDFCAGHPDLVAALAERGVFLKQKSYQEPDRKHTYKIDMSGNKTAKVNVTSKKDDSQKIDRRRRRRASSKKVRAM